MTPWIEQGSCDAVRSGGLEALQVRSLERLPCISVWSTLFSSLLTGVRLLLCVFIVFCRLSCRLMEESKASATDRYDAENAEISTKKSL